MRILFNMTVEKITPIRYKFIHINSKEFAQHYCTLSQKNMAQQYGVSEKTIPIWAKQLNLPAKQIRIWNHRNWALSPIQRQVSYGSLLGDGSLSGLSEKNGKGHARNSRYQEAHGIAQSELIIWKQI